MAPYTENPINGATEEWMIVNLTEDSHPIHLHLVQFQLVSRQKFNVAKYTADWVAANAVMWPTHESTDEPNSTHYSAFDKLSARKPEASACE